LYKEGTLVYEHPPLSIWPTVLERVNKIDFLDDGNYFFDSSRSSYRLGSLFCLIKGPALFDGVVRRVAEVQFIDEK
jgi:hypothetical protein